MSTQAVISLAGKQFLVKPGEQITIDKHLQGKAGDAFSTDQVLMLIDEKNQVKVGSPLLSGSKVDFAIKEIKLGDKVNVARFRAKSRTRRVKGHRQPQTILEVKKISSTKTK